MVGRVRWEGTLRSNFHVHWAARGKGWDGMSQEKEVGTSGLPQVCSKQRGSGTPDGREAASVRPRHLTFPEVPHVPCHTIFAHRVLSLRCLRIRQPASQPGNVLCR